MKPIKREKKKTLLRRMSENENEKHNKIRNSTNF